MGAIKLTFDGANNTAKMDAMLGAFLTNYENGIIIGLGDDLSYSYSNGKVTFKEGYICVYGRRVYIEDGTSVDIKLDSDKYGFVVLNINTSTNEVSITTIEKAGSQPSLTQDNLLEGDGLYQFVMCAYIKSSSSIKDNRSYSRSFISSNLIKNQMTEEYFNNKFEEVYEAIDETSRAISEEHGMYFSKFSKNTGNKYYFNIPGINLDKSLIIVPINNQTTVTLPGKLLLPRSSVNSIQYTLDGATYSLLFESSNGLIFTVGHSSHKLKYIYVYY